MCVSVNVSLCVYDTLYICIYVFMYVCMYLWPSPPCEILDPVPIFVGIYPACIGIQGGYKGLNMDR